MKFSVLTHNGIFSLSSNYIDNMYPSNKLYKACVEISEFNNLEKVNFRTNKPNSLAGPLSIRPNNKNGNSRKQSLLQTLDYASNHNARKTTDRLHWKGKSIPPSPRINSLASIQPSTTLTKNTTTVAGGAMAVGIILQVGRAKILYKTIKAYLTEFAEKTQKKNPDSIGAAFSVTIIYLKVNRPYGRAPIFGGVYLDKIIRPNDEFNANKYVNDKVKNICKPKVQSMSEKLESININQLDYPSNYETATLFVKCNW